MIESIGSSITDYAKQERELFASRQNSIKSAETSEASASSDAAAIANSEQQISDTEQVKTRAPQYDTVEISEEGMQMAKQQGNNSAGLNSAASIDSAEETEQSQESSSSTATKDLSSYSADELNDMADEGSITQLEKNTELARRAAEEAADKQDSDNSAVTSDEMINVSANSAIEDEE